MAGSEGSAAYAEGAPCWIDAQLPDVEAGKRFYGGLFGWTFEPFDPFDPFESFESFEGRQEAEGPYAPEGPYADAVRACLDGEPVAALVPKRDGRMPTVWTVYFATPDVRGMADRIRKGGGQVVTAPVRVGPYGIGALVADPEGAVFGLWQAGTHPGFSRHRDTGDTGGTGGTSGADGTGGTGRPGTFGWVELYARDTATAEAFYPGLFHDALFGPGATREFGRAHISDVFPAEMPPHFLVHFGVRDCEALLGTVARLGGRVRVPPFETSYGRVAVVSDNQGASFALFERRDAA
ncbi:VOC family protein [Streptomyces aurantiacus]|uniref:Hydrolase n=1 Tax=Streptomyces aurantiacus TaxID=47760 RepID=A0A7G1NZ59_9ACTN|nr:VOC family protein [Streptomyces aurantiacus]BCL28743.1 hydrolase [Streptomyces aurantiacus]